MSNLPPLNLVDGTLFIDNSGLELISTCPRQAQYYLLHRRENAAERPALSFGGIIHKMLEVRYRNMGECPEGLVPLMLAALDSGFAKWSPPEGDFRNYDTAVSVLQHYLKTYPLEPFEVKDVEVPFSVPFGTFTCGDIPIRVVLQGRIDYLGSRDGQTMFMDHKTTSMMGPSYFKDFEMSSQFSTYAWAIQQLVGTMPAFGIVNALGIRKPTKTGQALDFQRYTVRFTEEKLQEWHADVVRLIQDFLTYYSSGFFPRHTKWCVGKYGECQYYNVCTLPAAQRLTMLATGDYKDVTWDPTKNE